MSAPIVYTVTENHDYDGVYEALGKVFTDLDDARQAAEDHVEDPEGLLYLTSNSLVGSTWVSKTDEGGYTSWRLMAPEWEHTVTSLDIDSLVLVGSLDRESRV